MSRILTSNHGGAIMTEQRSPATGQSLLCQIREANKSFLAGRTKSLDSLGDPFLLIACYDPRLTELLGPALGLPMKRVYVISVAGNIITRASHDVIRSIAAALYVRQCKEILVLGHTDCAMATFSAPQVIDAFRAAGVSRSAFGDADLRQWFGAFADIRVNVLEGLESLRNLGIVPLWVRMHGAIIDTVSGELTVVYDGDLNCRMGEPPVEVVSVKQAPPVSASSPQMTPVVEPSLPVVDQKPPAVPRTPKGPIIVLSPERPPRNEVNAAASLSEVADTLSAFIASERANPKLRSDLLNLRNRLKSEHNPARMLSSLHQLAVAYAARYPRLPGALEYLGKHLESREITGKEMLEMLHLIIDKV